MMEGISHEAASIAGHLKLGNLTYIYDDNKITLDGNLDESMSEDVAKRFEAYGWRVQHIDGHDHAQITKALDEAKNEHERPFLILARTHIGNGAPHKHDTHKVHGEPLGPEETKATKEANGWPLDKLFYVPAEVRALWDKRKAELQKLHAQWNEHEKKWLGEQSWCDGKRVGIMGGSYGGYMVLAALAYRPQEFTLGIDIFGVSNWLRTLESIPPWWASFRDSLYAEVGDPVADRERLTKQSPLFHADKICKPLLVVQGANDPRVLKVESDEIVAACKRNGVPVEYLQFADEGHGFQKKANRIAASEAFLSFAERFFGMQPSATASPATPSAAAPSSSASSAAVATAH